MDQGLIQNPVTSTPNTKGPDVAGAAEDYHCYGPISLVRLHCRMKAHMLYRHYSGYLHTFGGSSADVGEYRGLA